MAAAVACAVGAGSLSGSAVGAVSWSVAAELESAVRAVSEAALEGAAATEEAAELEAAVDSDCLHACVESTAAGTTIATANIGNRRFILFTFSLDGPGGYSGFDTRWTKLYMRRVKILVPLKRVADPDNANKIKISPNKIDTVGLEFKPNPFDEYAVETALRLTENGTNTKQRLGEVIVVTFGPKDTEQTLRAALATGADRAIRVDATDDQLDGDLVARALKALVEKEKPDLVLLGKQEVEGDANQVGQLLAEYLGWPQATFAGSIKSEGDKVLTVGREVDGGSMIVKVTLPAVVTVDLRIVSPHAVASMHKPDHTYQEGVRFAALMAIMAAKKKPLVEMKLAELAPDTALKIQYLGFEPPPARKAGVKVKTVAELVQKLRAEAKVIQ